MIPRHFVDSLGTHPLQYGLGDGGPGERTFMLSSIHSRLGLCCGTSVSRQHTSSPTRSTFMHEIIGVRAQPVLRC